ncbi:hypothetical protein [Maricaulis parjimensis]|uniref:hypothetical protein n=1 Tax=Maricaulis parjimensis TaxID=144023 RepID=UPI001939270E|nr:hypothetical protein [Maricaulis parjimensis]
MIAIVLASLTLTTDLPDDPEQYSAWMQQSCQIQQVSRSGGEPDDHVPFCGCLDSRLRDSISLEAYRVFALGSQGAIQDQAMVDDWEAARDAATTEAAALPEAERAELQPALQGALGACLSLAYQGE